MVSRVRSHVARGRTAAPPTTLSATTFAYCIAQARELHRYCDMDAGRWEALRRAAEPLLSIRGFLQAVGLVLVNTTIGRSVQAVVHGVACVAFAARVFLVHYPVLIFRPDYEFFSLAPMPMFSLSESHVAALQSDWQLLLTKQDELLLGFVAFASILAAVITLCRCCFGRYPAVLWRALLLLFAAAWLYTEVHAPQATAHTHPSSRALSSSPSPPLALSPHRR